MFWDASHGGREKVGNEKGDGHRETEGEGDEAQSPRALVSMMFRLRSGWNVAVTGSEPSSASADTNPLHRTLHGATRSHHHHPDVVHGDEDGMDHQKGRGSGKEQSIGQPAGPR